MTGDVGDDWRVRGRRVRGDDEGVRGGTLTLLRERAQDNPIFRIGTLESILY